MTVVDGVVKRPRASKAAKVDLSQQLRASAHAWLSGAKAKAAAAPKKEPRPRASRREAAPKQDQARLLRASAYAWLSGAKAAAAPKKEPRPRASRREAAPKQDQARQLRASAYAWLAGAKAAAAPKKEPRPRASRREAASKQDPARRLRASAHAWLSGAKAARAPKKEPRPRASRREAASKQDQARRLRASAHAWLSGAKAARAPKREPRATKTARPDPIARLRTAAWAQLVKATQGSTPRASATSSGAATAISAVARKHLKGVIEALIFASERPVPARELARTANADHRIVRELLGELIAEYDGRGFRLDEVAGGFVFRTSPAFAPFVREVTDQKPVKMSRAQVETLAIVAYRQPITRPEVDEVRGVDSGAALKSLLERDLVRILGKKDEPGRPMLYGTTAQFLEFFGLKALADLPTLREFTELTEESRRAYERELGEEPPDVLPSMAQESFAGGEGAIHTNIVPPSPAGDRDTLEESARLQDEATDLLEPQRSEHAGTNHQEDTGDVASPRSDREARKEADHEDEVREEPVSGQRELEIGDAEGEEEAEDEDESEDDDEDADDEDDEDESDEDADDEDADDEDESDEDEDESDEDDEDESDEDADDEDADDEDESDEDEDESDEDEDESDEDDEDESDEDDEDERDEDEDESDEDEDESDEDEGESDEDDEDESDEDESDDEDDG